VIALSKALDPGQALSLASSFRPVPLIEKLEELGHRYGVRRTGRGGSTLLSGRSDLKGSNSLFKRMQGWPNRRRQVCVRAGFKTAPQLGNIQTPSRFNRGHLSEERLISPVTLCLEMRQGRFANRPAQILLLNSPFLLAVPGDKAADPLFYPHPRPVTKLFSGIGNIGIGDRRIAGCRQSFEQGLSFPAPPRWWR